MKKTTIALFLGAVLLLAFAGTNGARAALNYYSDNIQTTLIFDEMSVTMVEKNAEDEAYHQVSGDGLLANLLGEEKDVVLGKKYPEFVAVQNNGSIDEFVRVSVYRYWLDKDGNKDTTLDPSLIGIEFAENGGWVKDESATTTEREVYYYTSALASGAATSPLIQSITIDPILASKVRTEQSSSNGSTVVSTYYEYDGETFVVSCKVDSVQTHNAKDAIYSAWGKEVISSGSTMRLK